MRKMILAVTIAACAGFAASLAAQSGGTVTEAETGKSFPVSNAFGGAAHTLIGVGAFEAFGAVDVYGAGFYVQTDAAGRSWQRFLRNQAASYVDGATVNWGGLKDSSTLYQWIYSGSFGKAIWIKMVRDVTRQQVIDLHEDVMRRLVENFDVVKNESPLKDYIDATCQDGHDGDELMIWSRGSRIYVKGSGRELVTIENASSIIRPVWQLWFGGHPIQVPLRRALVNNIESLGGPQAEE